MPYTSHLTPYASHLYSLRLLKKNFTVEMLSGGGFNNTVVKKEEKRFGEKKRHPIFAARSTNG